MAFADVGPPKDKLPLPPGGNRNGWASAQPAVLCGGRKWHHRDRETFGNGGGGL